VPVVLNCAVKWKVLPSPGWLSTQILKRTDGHTRRGILWFFTPKWFAFGKNQVAVGGKISTAKHSSKPRLTHVD
jgi:hypothetical protein